jgi:hypothetical protein
MQVGNACIGEKPADLAFELAALGYLCIDHETRGIVRPHGQKSPPHSVRHLVDVWRCLFRLLAHIDRPGCSIRGSHVVVCKRQQDHLFSRFGIDEANSARISRLGFGGTASSTVPGKTSVIQ